VLEDLDTVLLDKTGAITMGNRHATDFISVGQSSVEDLGRLAALSSFSLAEETPEGKSIVRAFEDQQRNRKPMSVPTGARPALASVWNGCARRMCEP
jgi:high-affinity K+ transport system ATPase subunit B